MRDVDATSQYSIEEMDLPSAPIKGTFYWNEFWLTGTVTFSSGKTVSNLLLRYDLENHTVEVNIHGDIRTAFPEQLSAFQLKDAQGTHTFINTRQFSQSPATLQGYFEVLVDDDIALLKHEAANIKKANYVAALDMGRRRDEIVRKERYYVSTSDQLIELSANKKKSLEALDRLKAPLEKFIREHHLSFRNEPDMVRIVRYL